METFFYSLIFILFIEIFLRIIISVRNKTFKEKGLINSLINPYVKDWHVLENFGDIKKSEVKNRFRFKEQTFFMGLSEKQFSEIAAKANNTNIHEIKKIYSGSDAFERLSYQPFVGLFNEPNQKLSYANVGKFGGQGNVEQIEKQPKVRRVMLVGGSVAFGVGVTSIENNITSKLQKYLNSQNLKTINNEDIIWEVINLSFIASQSISELNLINMYMSLYKPDYVIQLSGFNDLYFYLNSNSKLFTFNFSSDVKKFLHSSIFVKVFDKLCNYFVIARVLKKIMNIKNSQEKSTIYTVY